MLNQISQSHNDKNHILSLICGLQNEIIKTGGEKAKRRWRGVSGSNGELI
jgi:hypothetical protein